MNELSFETLPFLSCVDVLFILFHSLSCTLDQKHSFLFLAFVDWSRIGNHNSIFLAKGSVDSVERNSFIVGDVSVDGRILVTLILMLSNKFTRFSARKSFSCVSDNGVIIMTREELVHGKFVNYSEIDNHRENGCTHNHLLTVGVKKGAQIVKKGTQIKKDEHDDDFGNEDSCSPASTILSGKNSCSQHVKQTLVNKQCSERNDEKRNRNLKVGIVMQTVAEVVGNGKIVGGNQKNFLKSAWSSVPALFRSTCFETESTRSLAFCYHGQARTVCVAYTQHNNGIAPTSSSPKLRNTKGERNRRFEPWKKQKSLSRIFE